MQNYKLTIQYDGTRYNGWQRQGNTENTIQGKLNEIIGRYLGEEIDIAGSGRTDAGVHALGQVANFKTRKCLDRECFLKEINDYLPHDIRITEADGKIKISFTGNGFLQNMVRIMAGTLIEVGLFKREPESMTDIIEARSRDAAGKMVPPEGLFLKEVVY